MKIKPFTTNLVFFDAEFTTLNPYEGEIMSLGMVFNDKELYLELEYEGDTTDWVKKYVEPHLTGQKITRQQAFEQMKKFLGDTKPYLISYVNQYDVIFLHKLLDQYEYVPYWLPIDFSTILFSLGYDPEVLRHNDENFLAEFDIDITKYKRHNALEDARLLKDIYEKVITKYK